ncbi:MAG: pitrilysin family protein [candidate division Zixibacteria bacterium]|nr:pitrilysin family protein [candidate division Zixibacteria bacterium]
MKTIQRVILIGVALLIAASVGPVWGKIKPLTYPPLNPFEIPQPQKVTLDNGMRIYLLEDHTLPMVNINVAMNRCGSYLEPPDKIGLADMTFEVMRTGGTTTKTGDQIDEDLEAVGASVETGGGTVNSIGNANALSDYSEKVLATLADVLRNPVFDPDKIELAKTNQRSAISRRNDQPMQMAIREFTTLLYGADSPYARVPEYATIDAVTREDMMMFHKAVVQPNNMQVAVLGDFKAEDMLVLLKKYFGDWPKGTRELPPPPEVDYAFRPTVNYAEKTDVNQSNILMGHIGGKMGDPDYPATIVMNGILGGGFGSRLTNNVRVKLGLAYTAQGNFTFQYTYPGLFYAYAATKSQSTGAAIREMVKQIKSMQTDPPTAEEMRLAKDGWLNSFVFNFESRGQVVGRMMTYDYYGFPLDYLQQLKTAVEKVTPQDVVEVAKRKLNPDNLQILVVGKADDFDEPLSNFGAVNAVDITIPAPPQEAFAANEEELKQGQAMLLKTVDACGGVAAFKKIKSINSSGKMTMNTPQGAFTIDVKSLEVFPDKSREEVVTPMGSQIMVISGADGWMEAGGQKQMLPAAQVAESKKENDRNTTMLFARADNPDYKVAYKGEEDFQGKKAIRLEFLAASGVQFSLFVDPAGYMPVGMKFSGQTMAGPGTAEQIYNEYKEISGVKLPVKMTINAGGMTIEMEKTMTTINGQYDASLFNKPEGI